MLQLTKVMSLLLFGGASLAFCNDLFFENLSYNKYEHLVAIRSLQQKDSFFQASQTRQEGLSQFDFNEEKGCIEHFKVSDQKVAFRVSHVLHHDQDNVFSQNYQSQLIARQVILYGLCHMQQKNMQKVKLQLYNEKDRFDISLSSDTSFAQAHSSNNKNYQHKKTQLSPMSQKAQKVVNQYKAQLGMKDEHIDLYVGENLCLPSAGRVNGYAEPGLIALSGNIERNLFSDRFEDRLHAKFVIFHELTHIQRSHLENMKKLHSECELHVEKFRQLFNRFIRYYYRYGHFLDIDEIKDEMEELKEAFLNDAYFQHMDTSLYFRRTMVKSQQLINKEMSFRMDRLKENLQMRNYWDINDRVGDIIEVMHRFRFLRSIWIKLPTEFEADANAFLLLQCYQCVKILRDRFVSDMKKSKGLYFYRRYVHNAIVPSGGYFDYEAYNDLIWCLQQQGCLCEYHAKQA